MYAKPEDVEEYLNNNPKKPYILCEFMHDMGNSMGGLGSYMKLIDKYDMYQGGFIWDFIDQAILVKDPVTGKEVLRYGGDFDACTPKNAVYVTIGLFTIVQIVRNVQMLIPLMISACRKRSAVPPATTLRAV